MGWYFDGRTWVNTPWTDNRSHSRNCPIEDCPNAGGADNQDSDRVEGAGRAGGSFNFRHWLQGKNYHTEGYVKSINWACFYGQNRLTKISWYGPPKLCQTCNIFESYTPETNAIYNNFSGCPPASFMAQIFKFKSITILCMQYLVIVYTLTSIA